MRKDKEKAIQLRHQGKSYKQIHRELGIGTSTLAWWFKHEPWSQEIKARLSAEVSWSNPRSLELLAQANRERWKLKHEQYRTTAVKEFPKFKHNPLFLAGVMLYWGEGDKKVKNCLVSLSNSDPEMIKIFNNFLISVCGVSRERIKLSLILYPDLIDSVQKNLWSKLTNIPITNFNKSSFIKGRHPTKRNSYGVCLIRVSSRYLKEKIIAWIKLYQNELRNLNNLV